MMMTPLQEPENQQLVVQTVVSLDRNPYSIHRSLSDRAFRILWETMLDNIKDLCTLNSSASYTLYSFDNQTMVWLVHFGGDSAARIICNNALISRRIDIYNTVNRNTEFSTTELVITGMEASSVPRNSHCYNGIKDEGEINTDCGHEACDIKCHEKQTCVVGPDCVQECFASICQFYSGAGNVGAGTVLLAMVMMIGLLF